MIHVGDWPSGLPATTPTQLVNQKQKIKAYLTKTMISKTIFPCPEQEKVAYFNPFWLPV